MDKDQEYMRVALNEAQLAYRRGDLPVGAALYIDDLLIGRDGNTATTLEEWWSHAESLVIRKYARAIQRAKKENRLVELYTTLDPCLQCMGAISLNRIDRIVYACRDPNGGASHIDPKTITPWYETHWPKIEIGVLMQESYDLITQYMREHEQRWGKILKTFEDMKK